MGSVNFIKNLTFATKIWDLFFNSNNSYLSPINSMNRKVIDEYFILKCNSESFGNTKYNISDLEVVTLKNFKFFRHNLGTESMESFPKFFDVFVKKVQNGSVSFKLK